MVRLLVRESHFPYTHQPTRAKAQRELGLSQKRYRTRLFNNRLSTRKSTAPASGDDSRTERSFLRLWGYVGLCAGLRGRSKHGTTLPGRSLRNSTVRSPPVPMLLQLCRSNLRLQQSSS